MLAKELRIGNWVDTVYNIPYIKITEIKNYVVCGKNCKGISYPSLKPIALTEEILLKCGATVDGIEHIIKARALPIKIRFHSGIAYCEFGNVYLGDRIKHLHQLQNLYYALCGEELEVKI